MKRLLISLLTIILFNCSDEIKEKTPVEIASRDSIELIIKELCESGRFSEAEIILDTLKPFNEKDFSFYSTKARLKFELNKMTEALLQVNRALKIAPRHSKSLFLKAIILRRLDFEDSALIYLNRAILFDPKNAEYVFARANINAKKEIEALVEDDINTCIELDKSHAANYLVWRSRFKLFIKDTIGAIDDCDTILQFDPNNYDANGQKAYIFFVRKDYKYAVTLFNKTIEINPNSMAAYYYRALSKEGSGNKNGFCDDIEIAIRLGSKDAAKELYKCEDYYRKHGKKYEMKVDTINKWSEQVNGKQI
jgi:tetratricopeptide (TPR) repeat protein